MLRKCIIVLALGLLLAAPASARKYGDNTMLVSPSMFVLEYQGSRLTVHTEISFGDIDRNSLEMSGAVGTSIRPVFVKSDNRGMLVAKFAADDIRTIIEVPRTTLTLTGNYKDGEPFSLFATIRVK
jgi:hypothetical protein